MTQEPNDPPVGVEDDGPAKSLVQGSDTEDGSATLGFDGATGRDLTAILVRVGEQVELMTESNAASGGTIDPTFTFELEYEDFGWWLGAVSRSRPRRLTRRQRLRQAVNAHWMALRLRISDAIYPPSERDY